MTLDPSILLRGRGVQLPDPYEQDQRRMTLAALSDAAQIRKMQMEDLQRNRQNETAIGETLGGLDINDDAHVQRALMQLPAEARKPFLTYVADQRKKGVDIAKEKAGLRKTNIEADAKALEQLGGNALALSQSPMAGQGAIAWFMDRAKAMGVDTSAFPSVMSFKSPQEVLSTFGKMTIDAAKQIEARDRELVRTETGRHNLATEGLTREGQLMTDARARQHTAAMAGATRDAGMTPGQPQEIMVDGIPVLAIFDKKTGTFFDANTRQPIRGGIGPKAGELPASIREKMAQNNVTLTKIENALKALDAYPDAFGMKNYAPDAVVQRVDPSGVDGRAMVADIAGQRIHDRSGAAVTIGEMARLRPYIPNVTDHPDVVRKKLQNLQREYVQVQNELAAGRSVAELMASRESGGQIGGQPAAPKAAAPAKPRLGEVRDGYMYKGGEPSSPSSWEKVSQ